MVERVGRGFCELSFAIVCAGIVLALSLAVGLGSRQAVTRGWEQRANEAERRATTESVDEIHHM